MGLIAYHSTQSSGNHDNSCHGNQAYKNPLSVQQKMLEKCKENCLGRKSSFSVARETQGVCQICSQAIEKKG